MYYHYRLSFSFGIIANKLKGQFNDKSEDFVLSWSVHTPLTSIFFIIIYRERETKIVREREGERERETVT